MYVCVCVGDANRDDAFHHQQVLSAMKMKKKKKKKKKGLTQGGIFT